MADFAELNVGPQRPLIPKMEHLSVLSTEPTIKAYIQQNNSDYITYCKINDSILSFFFIILRNVKLMILSHFICSKHA